MLRAPRIDFAPFLLLALAAVRPTKSMFSSELLPPSVHSRRTQIAFVFFVFFEIFAFFEVFVFRRDLRDPVL
jgi:hypothetical protein